MPIYSRAPSTPFTGNLPGMIALGPPDLRVSSSTAPYYQAQEAGVYGRQLAGLGSETPHGGHAERALPGTTSSELALLASEDDIQGDGIFDPFATEPNNYPDAGVFADRLALPGYIVRDPMYAPSEVLDATTGRPVVYVNAGAVSMDSAAQIAYLERGAYRRPEPVIQGQEDAPTAMDVTANVMQGRSRIPGTSAAQAYAGLGRAGLGYAPMRRRQLGSGTEPPSTTGAAPSNSTAWLATAGLVGIGLGVAIGLSMQKKKGKR